MADACIRDGDERVQKNAVDMLVSQGRMKFVRPLYRDLYRAAKQAPNSPCTPFIKSSHVSRNMPKDGRKRSRARVDASVLQL